MLYRNGRRLPPVAGTASPLFFCLRFFSLHGKRSFAWTATPDLVPTLEPVQGKCCGSSPADVNAALCNPSPAPKIPEEPNHSHGPAFTPRRPPVTRRESTKLVPRSSSHLNQDAQLFEGEGIAAPPSPRRGRSRVLSSTATNAGASSTLAQECSPADGNTSTRTALDRSQADASMFLEIPSSRTSAKSSRSSHVAETAQLLMEEGISQVDLEHLIRKRGFLTCSHEKLSAVLQLLKPFSGINACKIIAKNPGILRQPIEHLQEKINLFETSGISPKVLVKMGTCDHFVFTMKMEDIIQRLNYLTTVGFKQQERERLLLKAPVILRLCVDSGLQSSLAYLRSKGMDEQELLRLVVRQPGILAMSGKSLAIKFGMLEAQGLTAEECFRAISFVRLCSTSKIQKIICLFRNTGFTDEAIRSIVKKQPDVLSKAEENLKLKLHYLIDIYKREREEIARFPSCLCYDLKNRVIPRLNTLKEINPHKSYRLSSVLTIKDSVFLKRYAVPDSAGLG